MRDKLRLENIVDIKAIRNGVMTGEEYRKAVKRLLHCGLSIEEIQMIRGYEGVIKND